MTDTWYTFGAMVADPNFFPVIAKVPGLKFDLIRMYVVEDGPDGRAAMRRKSAGYLDMASTTGIRRDFRDYAKANLAQPAPVISLYTAGKFCQLFFTLASFGQVFSLANDAFKKCGGTPKSSVELLTALGIGLLDSGIATTLLTGGTMPGDSGPLIDEFRMNADDVKTLQATLREPDFNDARSLLMTAGCWTEEAPCPEFLGFYEGFKRAVN
jgi:hypothetical protein